MKNAYDQKSKPENPDALNGETAVNDNHSVAAVKSSVVDPPRFVVPNQGGVDILKLLTDLEDLVEHAPHLPMGTLFRFDEDRFHMTIMKIRANLPEDLKRASKLARDSERIVEETRESATMEMEKAKVEAARLREQAQAEAKNIRETAIREAQRIRDESHMESEGIVAVARVKAEQLVAESALLEQAQAQVEAMHSRAHEEAEAIRHGADDYAHDVLANLEHLLTDAAGQVRRGREMLESH